MPNLKSIIPNSDMELEILNDILSIIDNENDLTPQSLADDIGDDDNAGGYNYTKEQIIAFCQKHNINMNEVPTESSADDHAADAGPYGIIS